MLRGLKLAPHLRICHVEGGNGILLVALKNRRYIEIPAAADLRYPLTDRRAFRLARLSANSASIWDGASQREMALVLVEGGNFSKFSRWPRAPDNLRSFAAEGAFSMSSARIMSTTQRASLQDSILLSAS